MIIKGNYHYPSFSEMKPNLIEAFVEYYGEEYRAYITYKLDNVDVHFFTGLDSTEEYVGEKLPKVRDTVIKDFLDKYGVKGSSRDRVKKALFTIDDIVGDGKSTALGDHSRLALAVFTTRKDYKDIFTEDEQAKLDSYRLDICKAFGVNPDNTASVNMLLQSLEDLRIHSMDTLEYRLGQAGHDDFSVERREKKALVDLYKYVSSKVKLDKKDIKKMSIYNNAVLAMMQCRDIYSSPADITNPGAIFAFTSSAEDVLLGDDDTLKDNIYEGRIRYFNKMGLYVDRLDSDTPKTLYQKYMSMGADKLVVPKRLADKIDAKRESLVDTIYGGLTSTQYFERVSKDYVSPLTLEKTMGYIPNNYEANFIRHGKKYIHRGVVCIDCDAYINPDDILCNLIHELGHHLQHHIIDIEHRQKLCTIKESIEREDIVSIGVPNFIYDCMSKPDAEDEEMVGITNILEYVNEEQAKEIARIFLSKYKNPFSQSDISVPTRPFSSQYDKASILLQDIWQGHREDIKHECISGEPTFSGRFGYSRLKAMDDVVAEFYRDPVTVESPFCDYVYSRLPFSSIPKDIQDKVMAYKYKIISRVNSPNM